MINFKDKKSKLNIFIKTLCIIILITIESFLLLIIISFSEKGPYRPNLIEKPIIYLYPKEDNSLISVKIDSKLPLTTIYPNFNNNNQWIYNVDSDGTIYDNNNNKYPYLYYEAIGNINYDLSKGFVVKKEDTKEFLEKVLTKFGLNYKEKTDFITYWLPRLEKNQYNLIHFSDNEYENQVKLNIKPKPDNILRIYMVFKALNEPIDIQPQEIKGIKDNDRNDFIVIEWGGTELK